MCTSLPLLQHTNVEIIVASGSLLTVINSAQTQHTLPEAAKFLKRERGRQRKGKERKNTGRQEPKKAGKEGERPGRQMMN